MKNGEKRVGGKKWIEWREKWIELRKKIARCRKKKDKKKDRNLF